MLFSTREICDVVLRAKSAQKIGNKVFYKNEPVIYFDSLKTSNLEEQTTTVYAQGGRGNARLIAWEGEKTVTFVMEDALLSPEGFSILSGADLVHASESKSIIVHKTEITNKVIKNLKPISGGQTVVIEIELKDFPYKEPKNSSQMNPNEDYIYVMLLDDKGEVISEPYIASEYFNPDHPNRTKKIFIAEQESSGSYISEQPPRKNDLSKFNDGCQVLVDYYVEKKSDTFEVNITPDKFSGNFYLEASTLFRATNGQDIPAQFIIPNCKIQSNFAFTMASSGDPSTFTFTIDAFPDYTRWNKNKKVFAAIQIIEDNEVRSNLERLGTPHNYKSEIRWDPLLTYTNEQAQYIEEEPPVKIINMIFDSIGVDGEIYNNGLGYKKGYYLMNGLEAQVQNFLLLVLFLIIIMKILV